MWFFLGEENRWPRKKAGLAAVGVAMLAALPATVGVGVLSAEAAAASSVTQPSVTLSSYEAGATDVTYTVGFKTSATGAIPAGGTINLIAPSGTLWPSGPCSYVLTDATTTGGSATGCDDGGLTPKVADPGLPIYNFVSFSGVAVQLTVPNAISAGDVLSITVTGVTNPEAEPQTLSVTTSSDTTPATSTSYTITPMTSVTQPSVTPSSYAAGATDVTYTLAFATSATNGAIPAGGTVTLEAPPGTVLPQSGSCHYALTDTTSEETSCPSTHVADPGLQVYNFESAAGAAVQLTVPNVVNAGDSLSLVITGVMNPGAGANDTFELSTSTDTTPETSDSYTITPMTSVTQPSVTLSSNAAAATDVTYTIDFITSADADIQPGGSITLIAPPGTVWPSPNFEGFSCSYSLSDSTTPGGSFSCPSLGVAEDGAGVSIAVPNLIEGGDQLSLAVTGVTNPGAGPGDGSQTLTASTSTDITPVVSQAYTVSGSPTSSSAVASTSLSPSTTSAGAEGVTDNVGFTTSDSGTLTGGSSVVNLVAPPGTIFGACPTGCGDGNATYTFTDLTNPSGSGSGSPLAVPPNTGVIGPTGNVVTVSVPNTIQPGDSVVLTVTQVTNPPAGADDTLAISTSSDTTPVTVDDPISVANSVVSPSVSTTTTGGGANGVIYTIEFTASDSGTLLGGQNAVTLTAPPGTIFGACNDGCGSGNAAYNFTDLTNPSGNGLGSLLEQGLPEPIGNGTVVSISDSGTIHAGDTVQLVITQATNPSAGADSEADTLAISTSSDTTPVSVADPISVPGSVSNVSLGITRAVGVTYTVGFTTSTTGTLVGGLSAITLAALPGTNFGAINSVSITDITRSSGSGTVESGNCNSSSTPPPCSVVDNGLLVSLVVPNTIQAGDNVSLTIGNVTGNVTNPLSEVGNLQVSTSSDVVPTTIARVLPTAPQGVAAAYGGPNDATVSWHVASDPKVVQGYLVSVEGGPNAGEEVAVPSTATAARVTGLVTGPQTFVVLAFGTFGPSPSSTTTCDVTGVAGPTYVSTVLADHPSVFYRLGDTTTALMADSSGNGADGYYNAANVTEDVKPGALASDSQATAVSDQGQPQFVATGAPVLPSGNASRTLEVWMKTASTSFGTPNFLASWGSSAQDDEFAVGISGSDQIEVSGYSDDHTFTAGSPLNNDQWHLVDVTYSGSTIVVYVDGKQIGTGTFNAALATTSGTNLLVGSATNGDEMSGFNLDDLAVYPSVLTATQVAADYTASLSSGLPSVPGSPKATAGPNQATVTWTAPASSLPIEGYLITALQGGTTRANAIAVSAATTSTVVSGLTKRTKYSFQIQGIDEDGLGPAATTTEVKVKKTKGMKGSTYVSTVLAEHPSVFYRLGDTTTALMADSSGNGAEGSYNAANVTQDVKPGALASDPQATAVSDQGQPQVVATGATSLPSGNSSRTLEVWLKTASTSFSTPNFLASWGSSAQDDAFAVGISAADQIEVSGYSDDHTFTASNPLNDDQWHLIDVIYSGSSIVVYVDGKQIGTGTFNATLATTSATPLLVGSATNGDEMSGFALDDLAVYPSVLTAAEITAHYTASADTP